MNATAIPTVEKQQFRNESPGWLGVVVIGPKGEDQGVSVATGDTIWLSEAEQILTANAPRLPEDNPFIEQSMPRVNNETGEMETITYTPLVPISEHRYVPANDRPIPAQAAAGTLAGAQAQASATAEEPEQPVVDAEAIAARERAVTENPATAAPNVHSAPPEAPPVPPRAAAAAAAAPSLAGDTPPAPPVAEDPDGLPPLNLEEQAAVAQPPEEHAETGAAPLPSQEAAEGEYAQHEEVGTPAAPAAAPEPYAPPSEA